MIHAVWMAIEMHAFYPQPGLLAYSTGSGNRRPLTKQAREMRAWLLMAEKEGFEPSIRY